MSDLLDAKLIADELGVSLLTLRRMSMRGRFPRMLRITRGLYRVERARYEAWNASRWTGAEGARRLTVLELADQAAGCPGRRGRRRNEPTFPAVSASGQFRRYDHLERFGHHECESIELGRVYVFPKLDGTNASVWLDGAGQLQCGSRNRVLTPESDNHGFCAWARSEDPKARALADLLRRMNCDPVVYGEWLVPHTIKSYREEAWRRFWIFDVFDRSAGRYLPWTEYGQPMIDLGLDVIEPLCVITNPSHEQLLAQVETNTYLVQDGAGVGEGVVLKRYDWTNRYGRQPWAKVVRNEFKESNRRSFGVTEKTGEFQVELAIAQEFCTPTLVGKTRAKVVAAVASAQGIDLTGPNAQRLVESVYRGKVIPQLLGRVFHDLVVEELWPAVKKHRNPVVDFKKLERCCTEQTKRLAADLFGLTVGGGA